MDFEIRKNRVPGGKRLVRERAAYFQLMEQGSEMAAHRDFTVATNADFRDARPPAHHQNS
ncbi:hypothetical protein [Streptomyces sp. NPDC017964]|uniref:hypothetical protein n=1 Tax=Streptomyces sp. NPDC017964 TaxID=3365022 RepID=UPI0037A692D3